MPASSSRQRKARSITYHVFVEIVHGRWVRLEVNAPSPQGALAQARQHNLNGKAVVVKDKAIYEYDERSE